MLKVVESVVVLEIYDNDGNFVTKKADVTYKDLVKLIDIIVGIAIALLIYSQVMV